MLAAAVLIALLGVATLRIATATARVRLHESRTAAQSWPPALPALFRLDLANARTLRSTPEGILLTGPCAIDPATGLPIHRPAEIRYSVETIANRPWLVRTQRDLTPPPGSPAIPTRALLHPDVGSLTTTPLTRLPLRTDSVPPALRITVTSTAPNKPPLETLVTR